MSKIKKALERAKAQGTIYEGKGDGLAGTEEHIKVETGAKEVPAPNYVKTKVVEVPHHVFISNKIVSVEDAHPIADQFKLLRTRIFQLTRQAGKNTIQISGFESDEGKSMVALNLAVSMAKDTRQTTLLVDVDFRRPSIHSLLGLPADTKGLKDYFEGRSALEDLFINPGIKKLTILPAGGRIPDSTEVVGSSKMEALVQELKKRYPDRYIIFDSPGLNVCPDPLVLANYVDGVVLVARSDHTQVDSIKTAVELLPKEKLLGTVLNDSRWYDPLAYQQQY